MDWPTSILILGGMVSAVVSLFKLFPSRPADDPKRDEWRNEIMRQMSEIKSEIVVIRTRFDAHEKHEDHAIEEVNRQIETISKKLDSVIYRWSDDGK